MAKNPVITLDQIIKLLSPKVVQVVKEHSVRLWQQVIIRHLTEGGQPPTAWAGAAAPWPGPPALCR